MMMNRSLILMYHRVAEEAADPWSLCVTPPHFEQQLHVLKKQYHAMQFRSLTQSLCSGKTHDHSVVLTFDDGYKDNLYNAKPLLQKHGIPATIFLVSGVLGKNREFWSDELETLLLHPGRLPESLHLEINENILEKNLEEAAIYSAVDYDRFRSWKAVDPPPTKRHSFYYWVWDQLRPYSDELRRQAIDDLRKWAGRKAPSNSLRCALSQNEVKTLSADGFIEIGSHTQTHPRLSSIDLEQQKTEIEQSKIVLEGFNWQYFVITKG